MMPRYSLRFLGGAAKVDELIGLAASNHGTQTPLAPVVGPLCRACAQQATGSPFLTNLNAGREVESGVDYTNVVTRYDEVVVPFRKRLPVRAGQPGHQHHQHHPAGQVPVRCDRSPLDHLRPGSPPVGRGCVAARRPG